MIEVISDFQQIQKEVGIDPQNDLLTPQLTLDADKGAGPLLCKVDGKNFLLAKMIEKGNLNSRTLTDVEVIYYSSYFTFEGKTGPAMVDALLQVLDNSELEVHPDLPYSLYRILKNNFSVKLKTKREIEGYYIYSIDKEGIYRSFNSEKSNKILEKLGSLVSTKFLEKLKSFSPKKMDRFDLLDRLMSQAGIKFLIASSPLNIQELTGIGYKHFNERSLAFYKPEKNKIYIISPKKLSMENVEEIDQEADLNLAARTCFDFEDSVGIEESDLPIGLINDLPINESQLYSATGLFRQWRELQGAQDLYYYIVATHSTKYAITKALEYAQSKLNGGIGDIISEKDVERKYMDSLKEFNEQHELPLRIEPYFTVVHSGSRSLFPSLAQDYKLKATKSLKIDAGVSVFDSYDILRACSDLARTLVFTEEGQELYGILKKVSEVALDNIKPGQMGEDIYWSGINELSKKEASIKKLGLIPNNFSLKKNFNRNLGHILGKQEAVTLTFDKSNKTVLSVDMIGCVEYQWPYKEYAIGYEDMFLVTGDGALNITLV